MGNDEYISPKYGRGICAFSVTVIPGNNELLNRFVDLLACVLVYPAFHMAIVIFTETGVAKTEYFRYRNRTRHKYVACTDRSSKNDSRHMVAIRAVDSLEK